MLSILDTFTLTGTTNDKENNMELKIMSFNFMGKNDNPHTRKVVAKAIKDSGANIVGMQEIKSADQAEDIKNNLGKDWFVQHQGDKVPNKDVAIFSQFPFRKHSAKKWGYEMKVKDDQSVWLFNCHLAYKPYGPWQLNNDTGGGKVCDPSKPECIKEVVEAQREARHSDVAEMLDEITKAREVAGSKDIFLINGDFNEPSHLDWTSDAKEKKVHIAVVPWPTSIQIEKAGFADSFRKLYPNSVENPGTTWNCWWKTELKGPAYNDRLDFIYYSEKEVTPVNTIFVGPKKGLITEDIEIENYPSDHRAIMTTFTIQDK